MNSEALEIEGSKDPESPVHESSSPDSVSHLHDPQIQFTSALEILRESVRILRFNSNSFMAILFLLICPVSAVFLTNVFVDQSVVKRLTTRLLLIARTNGLPLNPVLEQSCQRFSETAISTAMCFPFYMTLLLLSKSAVAYSVYCTYSKKQFDASEFCQIVRKLWRKVLSTYIWGSMLIVGVLTMFILLIGVICYPFLVFGFSRDVVFYPAMVGGLVFAVVFANAIIICNVAVVVSVLEDVSGYEALFRSRVVIDGQTQVGLVMYLGSMMGMAFVQGLFDHRVNTVSYGDGSSRLWEGPLLVLMYSFGVLIDHMMTAVFYFSCKCLSLESLNGEEKQSMLESDAVSPRDPVAE